MKPTARQLELEIQNAIRDWLEAEGYVVWRCSLGGVMARHQGRLVRAKNPMRGFPDLGAVHREFAGRLIAIEVKRPGEMPDAHQREWHQRLREGGALVIVAASVADVRVALAHTQP